MTGTGEYALIIELEERTAVPLPETSLADLKLLERHDLQAWVEKYPEMIGGDLMLIATEFDQWELHEQKVPDRLDVLMLDKEGHLLVAELKRGTADDTTDLQALKYAAYCANLTVEDVVEMHSRYAKIEKDAARSTVIEHAPSLEDNELGPVRVCLLAAGFGPSVSSVVLWLNEIDLDIACVQLVIRRVDDGRAVLSVRQVLPPPQAKDYLVRRRRRTEAEEKREATARKRQTVALLNDHRAVEAGTSLQLVMDEFRDDQRKAIEAKIASDPSYGRATWTGKPSRQSLRWEHDNKESSSTEIVWRLLEEVGVKPTGVHGTKFWRLPSGRSLWGEAEVIEAQEKGKTAPDRDLAVAVEAAHVVPGAKGENGAVQPAGTSE